MAITDGLIAQGDVNTRGRSDDTFYDHVDSKLGVDTGSPTTFSADGGRTGMSYPDGSHYTVITPSSSVLSAMDVNTNDVTVAVRGVYDENLTEYRAWFHARGTHAASSSYPQVALGTDNADKLAAVVGYDSAGGEYRLDTASSASSDGNEMVYLLTWDETDADQDALLQYKDGSVISGTNGGSGITNAVTLVNFWIGKQAQSEPPVVDPFGGATKVIWYAVWNRILTSDEINELDDEENPFAEDKVYVSPQPQRIIRHSGRYF